MKKTVLFLVIIFALFAMVSCNHPVQNMVDDLPDYQAEAPDVTVISEDGEVKVIVPQFPGSRNARDAASDAQHQYFKIELSSTDVSGFENREDTKHPGEIISFPGLNLGRYHLACTAWDDVTGLCFKGDVDIDVHEGLNSVDISMSCITETDHISIVPTTDGVRVTIKGIDFNETNSISVFDFTSASECISPYFGFELDDNKASEISESGDSYTFTWPFAPMKVNGKNRSYYVFQYQHVESATGNLIQEMVCCRKEGSKYKLNLTPYETLNIAYESDTSLPERRVWFTNDVSLNSLRLPVTKEVPLSEIGGFRAILETWAGDFVDGDCSWGTGNSVMIPKSGRFQPENPLEVMFSNLLEGDAFDILASPYTANMIDGDVLDELLSDKGMITPNFRWQFSLTDAPNGWFQLPPVKECFDYEPVEENEQNGILSVEIRDNIIYLKVNVPSETSYLTILEEGTDYSYAFTSKDNNGILTCSGNTIEIPWAFAIPDNTYAAFKACCTYSSAYTYREDTVWLYGKDSNGTIFYHPFLDYGGEPVIGRDIIINSNDFKVSMPQGKVVADYMLDFQNSGCELADSSIVYSLCFTNTDYNMDLRFKLSGNIPDETIQLFDSSVKYDIRSSESIYWSNNDENGGNTSFGWTQNHPSDYMYSLMHLQNNPAFNTKGALSYRLKYSGKYIDSGEEDSWLGEYRIALWDQGEYTQMNTYPPAEQTTRAAAGTKVGISMPTDYLQRWNKDGDNMKNLLEADGYTVDLEFAGDSELNLQIEQIEGMINGGCNVLIVAAVDGWNLSDCLAGAKNAGVKVIAYDRLISNTDAVSYYTTFNNWNVGVLQGEYVKTSLDLDNAAGPFYIEFFTGDKGDANVTQFFGGAMSVLEPYLNSGKLICLSGQTSKEACATSGWSADNAQSRMGDLIAANGYAPARQKLDAVLCSNDSTAQGVIAALKEVGYTAGNMPVVTGQDCDRPNAKMIKDGEQSMSVFKDTRTLVAKAVEMAESILQGNGVLVNDVSTYNNGFGIIPSLLVDPVCCDVSNYHELLIDSGYYSEFDLQ